MSPHLKNTLQTLSLEHAQILTALLDHTAIVCRAVGLLPASSFHSTLTSSHTPPHPAPAGEAGRLGSGDWEVPAPSNSSLLFLTSSPTSLPLPSQKGEGQHTSPGGVPPHPGFRRPGCTFRPLSFTPSMPCLPEPRGVGGGGTGKEQTSPPGAIRGW